MLINRTNIAISNIIQVLKIAFKYDKKLLYLSTTLTLIAGILPFIGLLNTQRIMNVIQTNNSTLDIIIISIIIFVSVEIFSEMLSSMNSHYTTVYSKYLSYKLNVDVLAKTKSLDLKDFENPYIYDLIQRAEQEAGIRPFSIISSLLQIFSSSIKLFLALSLLFLWHWWIVIILIILPILSSTYFLKINKEEFRIYLNRTKYERKSWYISHLLTKDIFIKEVKTLGMVPYFLKLFKNIRKKFLNEDIVLTKRRTIFTFLFNVLTIIFTNSIVIVAILESFIGKILLGNLMTYIRSTSMVEENVKSIIQGFFSLYQDALHSEQLVQFLNYKGGESVRVVARKSIDKIETIEFKNVYYKYQSKDEYALENINLILKIGEKIALVGENGSGKTTLIKLLTNLYDDYEGKILINGINIKDINKESIRKKISVIFQDYNEYQFTIRENISFGDIQNSNDNSKIVRVSEEIGSDTFINSLPKKYEQQVGQWFEGGVQLSGGQWQKLALSRTFYKEADIYILDEPTSALDPLSEYTLFKRFSTLTNNKIGLFITHRFVNAKFTNKIIVLEQGKIIEEGNHESLMKLNGKYASLYNLQLDD